MKINFALIGLGAAQSSGDGRESDYDYPAASEDRWEFNNGVTFADFSGKTTGNQAKDDFVLAMKLSCWNSNMIRDMNNDNKFQEYRFSSAANVAEDAENGWKYARGDLTTGMNHQYGFEPHPASQDGTNVGTAQRMDVLDANYAQRKPASATTDFHKWGYQTDGVNRAVSQGYDANTVVYHFGHADNRDNTANRPFTYDQTGTDGFAADELIFKDDWRFSLRMGGCLYEATEWVYDETSFNQVGRLTYSGDADFAANLDALFSASGSPGDFASAGSFFADVHWVHVFNAHIFPNRGTGYSTGATRDSITNITGKSISGATVGTPFEKTSRNNEDFNVVMANPTYEGHGFLNFVATYHDHVDIKAGRTGLAYAGYRFRSTIQGYTAYSSFTTECEDIRSLRAAGMNGAVGRAGDDRCGSAIYENFGDWYLRPAQHFDNSNNAQREYWGFIMPKGFDASTDSLWNVPTTAADAPYRDAGTNQEGMRGFAISSFPHNELGQDFRFNIRTLHNMGSGVANTQLASATAYSVDTATAIWSYYFYAVDSIKIAFPEYVARVNHCHFASHKSNPNCSTASDHDGWQRIIVDGATMKKTDAPTLANDTRFTNENSQYGFTHIMGRDAWSADLLMTDTGNNFADDMIDANDCSGSALGVGSISYNSELFTLPEDGKPSKPCASWCLDATGVSGGRNVCGRILSISGLLQTYDELHLRQYGTIQEVWVQLMYAYVESLDEASTASAAATGTSSLGVESPFPNVFFSAPEVIGLVAECDGSANFKCRGYLTDENQPYGGSRTEEQRVYVNNANIGAANDYHSDSVWASNDHSGPFTKK